MNFEKGYYKTHPCHDSFTCRVCGRLVVPEAAGSGHRNHCPNCLSSLHVDEEPGDRASDCGGVMDPIGVWVRRGGEWAAGPAPLSPGAHPEAHRPDGRKRQYGVVVRLILSRSACGLHRRS